MKVYLTYKSRYTNEIKSVEYSAQIITLNDIFLNITDEQGELYGFPIKNLKSVRIEDSVQTELQGDTK